MFINNIFGCTPDNSFCTIMHGVLWGVLFALGGQIALCKSEFLPWQGNGIGCWGQEIT